MNRLNGLVRAQEMHGCNHFHDIQARLIIDGLKMAANTDRVKQRKIVG
jgi:hypothetical protein